MRGKIAWITTIFVAVTAIMLISDCNYDSDGPPSITMVQKMGDLVSLKVNVSDIIVFNKPIQIPIIKLPVGGTKGIFVLKGDCLLSTNLTQANYEKDTTKRTVTLVLHEPTVTSPRVDFNASEFYAIESTGISSILPGGSDKTGPINAILKDAQARVEAVGKKPEYIQAAREHAEKVLKGMFRASEWELQVKWEK